MTLLHPYPPNPDFAPWPVGQTTSEMDETKYTFTTFEALVGHFSQSLGQEFVVNAIENEKLVFVVRKDVSLEETRLQFLKKCEHILAKALTEAQAGQVPDWGFSAN